MKKKVVISALLVVPAIISMIVFVSNYHVGVARENVWAIGIYEGRSPFLFFEPPGIKNPVISASDVTDVKASFVADPFLITKDSTWYMFFEVMNSLSNHGDIGLATSKDAVTWKYEKIVLDEDYHLSFPYVIRYNGDYYMIPESADAHQLNIYRAVEFPHKWEYVKTLLKGDFGDHGIIFHNNTWFLFAGSQPETHNTLRLYYSDSLFGIWKEHPLSPVVSDNADKARPGGRVIIWENKVIRYAQDCSPTYGKALKAFEITRLTRTEYSEKESIYNPVLKNSGKGWTRHGMHHLDAYKMDSRIWIGCVDGYYRQFIVKVDF
ncbi:MAG TPA: hypothetical protein VHP36_00035 [Chitinispirillaceae bacterium]|nr:hypothetical protein [Chitinispirillaceae bacterium]